MKHRLGVLFAILILISLTGCGKDIELTVENVSSNTLAIREDETIQVALVDSFDKDYYDIEEFKSFINEEINTYNNEYGSNSIILDSLEKKADKVILILSYANMEDYARFNHVEGQLTTGVGAINFELPESFLNKKGESVAASEALEKDDYKVFVINENIKVIIDGKIVYYYNGDYIDSQTLQADNEEMTFIIYKDKLF